MGRMRRLFAAFMAFSMIMQPVTAIAKLNFNNVGVLDTTSNEGKTWHIVPVKQGSQMVDCLTQEIKKVYLNNEGQKVEESGDVSVWVKGYAYTEGTGEEVKVGVTLTYLNAESNKYVTEWWEDKKAYSKEEISWPVIKDLHIELAQNLKFIGGNSNNQKLSISLKTNKGEVSAFQTAYPVAFQQKQKHPSEMNMLTFKTMDGGERQVDEYISKLDKNAPYGNSKIFNPPLYISPDSFIDLNLSLHANKDAEVPKYQIVSSDEEPSLPYTEGVWKPIESALNETGTNVQYTDMIDIPNLLTVQHYIYTPGYLKSPKEYGYSNERDRQAVFSSPVNKPVQQSTFLGTNKKYSTQAGEPAFFKKGLVSTKTTLEAVFVPKETGEYKFTVCSATGSKGVITVDGEEITFIDNFGIHIQGDERYYGLDTAIKLEAGKRYTIYMETRHATPYDKAPCFMYSMKPIEGWPADYYIDETQGYNAKYREQWHIVTPELLQEQNPSNGANRAMKLWGFIVPDISGEFNFGLQADDGAYGYLIIDNQKKVFVDSFGIHKTADKSNNVVLNIKEGAAYPFYLEWYEGSPYEQALAPRYRAANKGYANDQGWMDIPSDWFRPSSNLDIATDPLATYYGIQANKRIDLPYNDKLNYVIVQVQDEEGKQHQIKYGPFTGCKGSAVEFEKPQMDSDTNYIVPTSVSNINAAVVYNMDSKDISYEVDLNALKTQKLNGVTLFMPGLESSQINVVVQEGILKETGKLGDLSKVNSSDYKVSIVDEKIMIDFIDEERMMKKGMGHQIDIYLKVNLNKGVSYYDEDGSKWYYSTYRTNKVTSEGIELPDVKISITSNKKYKITEEVYDVTTNEIIMPAVYSTEIDSSASEIGLDLREIPGIN